MPLDERQPIARIRFTDGVVRPVFEDADGRQLVVDGEVLIYGVWVLDGADERLAVGG